MDDLDFDFPDPEVFPGPEFGDQMPGSCSINDFFDESLKDVPHHSCTHTHTCNHPGPNLSHTHTCFHVHTKIVSASAEETSDSAEKSSSKKRPMGNREAVRKYREKKKAHTASLVDEVAQLRSLNQQLMKRLQGQAALEAEATRLRCLLVDIRGRIEGEIGAFPYQRVARVGGDMVSNAPQGSFLGARIIDSCNLRCDDRVNCMQSVMQGKGDDEDGALDGPNFGACEVGNIQCMGSSSTGSKVILACGRGNAMAAGCSSKAKKTKATTTDG
ncbi:basic leucine zipper 23-like isoform X3 [Phoenix dactylifera]|uniref:Basic leucine zipper 23-like isoform X2 n=1 Tax=Phoenix dactylifera TaxID=42345 RepID=A0A8B7MVG8_PHODC|nr:basic leucine zipper 23-like isoform X2 [Phoenix dactylifera]XP_038982274.1 basic leucine zipper 23-like isoform X3 [Phoenix dactylifera]